MKLPTLLAALALGLALAQGAPDPATAAAQGAVREVLVQADVLRSPSLAEALRAALVTRGVAVYVLTAPGTVDERPSYFRSLALAGARVRLALRLGERELIADRATLVTGDAVAGLGPGAGAIQGPPVARAVQAFVRAFAQARALPGGLP